MLVGVGKVGAADNLAEVEAFRGLVGLLGGLQKPTHKQDWLTKVHVYLQKVLLYDIEAVV